MQKKKIQRVLALSGVISGMLALNSVQAHAVELTDGLSTNGQEQLVNSRSSNKGQVVNVYSTYLRIRAAASTSSEVLGTMIEGTKFDILSKTGGWYQIQYNGITGYVFEDYVDEVSSSTSYDVMYTGTVYNAYPNLRVRSGASLGSAVLGYVLDNSTVSIVGIENGWYKIEYNGGYGYVSGEYVSIGNSGGSSSDGSTITAVGYAVDLGGSSLRVRQSASTSSTILGSIYENDSVNIIGEAGNWYKILYNNSTAYVSKDYISLSQSSGSSSDSNGTIRNGYVVNVEGSNLRVRQSASSSSMVLGYLVNNENVEIVGTEGSWHKINYKNSVGYVHVDYIQIGGNSSSNESPSNPGSESIGNAYNVILGAMQAQVGAPYVWGGSGEYLTTNSLNELKARFPEDAAYGEYIHAEGFVNQGYRAFDCSGLMQWGFAQAGINIGRTTYAQINAGYEVSLSEVQPGDLLFSPELGHVGMYIGNDQWIESSSTGDYVKVRNVPWNYVGRARRVL